MPRRCACLLMCLACAGCHVLPGLGPDGKAAADAEAVAERLWHEGQAAVQDGRPAEAIARYEQSLAADPRRTRNHLSLAVAHLEAGNPSAACEHLAHYLAHHPEQVIVRVQFADLLLRLGRAGQARREFERFLGEAAERNDVEIRRRIHAHGRLMQLAEQDDDGYSACLHRGIGLFLLACGRAELEHPEGELPVEGLLCKAAGELTLARDLKPHESRPCWYLYLVWHRLGQQHLAERWLEQASATPCSLAGPELRSLHLALAHRNTRKRTW